jgi:hypothetical protein
MVKKDADKKLVDVDVVLENVGTNPNLRYERPGVAEKVRAPPKDVPEAVKLYLAEIAQQMSQATANLAVPVPGIGTLNLSCGSGRGELALNAVWLAEVGEEVLRRLGPKIEKARELEAERQRKLQEEYQKEGARQLEALKKAGYSLQANGKFAPAPCDTDSPSTESDKT